MKSRKEVAEFINDECFFDINDYNFKDYNNEHGRYEKNKYHFGANELKDILDYIYNGHPKNSNECIFTNKKPKDHILADHQELILINGLINRKIEINSTIEQYKKQYHNSKTKETPILFQEHIELLNLEMKSIESKLKQCL